MTDQATHQPTLITQFENVLPTILACGWANQAQIDRVRTSLMTFPELPLTGGRSRLAQFLIDSKLLSREQATEIDLLASTQRHLSNFKLLKKIGSGGMGIVYLATHLPSGRTCALKTLNARLAEDSDFVNRFQRETKAIVGIKHANIAEVIESGERDGHFYLAMEHIDGPSLMTLLKDYRALPELYALRITRQVAEGLSHVYAQSGLIHRDIKPENVLILRSHSSGAMFPDDDVAKLIDFGLAKATGEKDERLTQTGMTIGTPLYMSPEQVRGETLDCRSDIYGLGATLYHLLTGTTPFVGSSPGTIMSAHLTEPIPDPTLKVPSLNTLTTSLISMAMTKDVDKRFLTYEALINACTEAIDALAGQTTSAPQFLRKPLVLKTAVKKPITDRMQKNPASEPLDIPSQEQQREAISTRIRAKHQDMRSGASASPSAPVPVTVDVKQETSVTRAVSRVHAAIPAPVLAVASTQDEIPFRRKHLTPLPILPPAQTPSSLVLDEEARRAVGTGAMPWVLLGFAIAALAAYVIFLRS
ncbi:MAG: serine/threonine protein kinase [Planctomycetes bacterium]|nr:serine/threonine protein kinase [Planctomycetota bacterium]